MEFGNSLETSFHLKNEVCGFLFVRRIINNGLISVFSV